MNEKTNTPLVSIVMPCHNDEKYIDESIRSVLEQSYTNFELLIVDDGSFDNTINIIKGFTDDRIILFQLKSNHGAAYARNIALSHAKGDYIAFLDADDLWKPDKLDKQIRFMVKNKIYMSCTYYEIINDEGVHQHMLVKAPKKISHFHFLLGNSVGCLTVIYKKSIFNDLQIPNNIKKRNDYALWIKISEKTDCYCLRESLAYYRRRNINSVSSIKKKELLRYHVEMYRILLSWGLFRALFFSFFNVLIYARNKFFYVDKSSCNSYKY